MFTLDYLQLRKLVDSISLALKNEDTLSAKNVPGYDGNHCVHKTGQIEVTAKFTVLVQFVRWPLHFLESRIKTRSRHSAGFSLFISRSN